MSVMILNDQGGNSINVEYGICPTLRAQTHGHEPLVLDMTHANDVIRAYGGVVPTLNARMGTGGNQIPLILIEEEWENEY